MNAGTDAPGYSLENAREFQKRIPFLQQLGIVTESLGAGTARLALPLRPELTNSFGTAHGAVQWGGERGRLGYFGVVELGKRAG